MNKYYRVYYRVQVITAAGVSTLDNTPRVGFVDVQSPAQANDIDIDEDDDFFYDDPEIDHDLEFIKNDFLNEFAPVFYEHGSSRAYVGCVDLVEEIGFDAWPETQKDILKLYY